ncbi:hypothetical protein K4K55_011137 [Colletotrichum sp. SAR 10_96]|nr:hypothetical protein K4K55_011137 [Colletotrichum sp. SAR 10_96]
MTHFRLPDLPPELQDLIWEYVLPGPRSLRVSLDERRAERTSLIPSSFTFHGAGLPATLRTYGKPGPAYLRPDLDILHLTFAEADFTVFFMFAGSCFPEVHEIGTIAVDGLISDAVLSSLAVSPSAFLSMKRLLLVKFPTIGQLPTLTELIADRVTYTLELLPLSPDVAGEQRALELQKSINAERSDPGNTLHVEAILNQLVPHPWQDGPNDMA